MSTTQHQYLSREYIQRLLTSDLVDHRHKSGKWMRAVIIRQKENDFQIEVSYDKLPASETILIDINDEKEWTRFAPHKSISRYNSGYNNHFNIKQQVYIRPWTITLHNHWQLATIHKIDSKSDQILCNLKDSETIISCWVCSTNPDEFSITPKINKSIQNQTPQKSIENNNNQKIIFENRKQKVINIIKNKGIQLFYDMLNHTMNNGNDKDIDKFHELIEIIDYKYNKNINNNSVPPLPIFVDENTNNNANNYISDIDEYEMNDRWMEDMHNTFNSNDKPIPLLAFYENEEIHENNMDVECSNNNMEYSSDNNSNNNNNNSLICTNEIEENNDENNNTLNTNNLPVHSGQNRCRLSAYNNYQIPIDVSSENSNDEYTPLEDIKKQIRQRDKRNKRKRFSKNKRIEIKKFECIICHKKFRTKYQLKNHKLIHSSEKPYKCTQCSRSFKKKSYLKNHFTIHTGEKPYLCQWCKTRFRTWNECNNHISKLHGYDKGDAGARPYYVPL